MSTYHISVGEPWGFTGPDGKNIIIGELIKIVTEKCLIFKSDHEIDIDGIKGSIFILFPRYAGESFSSTIKKNESLTCGIGIYIGPTDEYLNMSSDQLKSNSKYVIIGGLHKNT